MADGVNSVGTPTSKSFNYPVGGERVVETRLGSLSESEFKKPDYNRWVSALKWGSLGAAAGAFAAGSFGALVSSSARASGGMTGAIIGAVLVGGIAAIVGATRADNRHGTARQMAEQDAKFATNFNAVDRPALPDASKTPTIEATTQVGEHVQGISGSSIGSVVKFSQKYLELTNVHVTHTENSHGEPLLSFGNVSGTTTSYDIAVNTRETHHNTLGVGKVLYDEKGYATLSEAKDAIDGKHSVAILADKGRYFVCDFDAESFEQINDSNAGMIISDDRVKAIYSNKNVYYPTNLKVGPSTEGEVTPSTGKVFLFGQGQDIDKTIPASVATLENQPIGMYDTNAQGTRDNAADLFTLNVTKVEGGDEYSGPGWADRAEAVGYMLTKEGNQALIHSGNRYYVADTKRDSVQEPYGENHYGDDGNSGYSLDDIVNASTTGSYIHGIRTVEAAGNVEVIEESGGLYSPVGDWWVKANLSE
jgi:hypothetical protein